MYTSQGLAFLMVGRTHACCPVAKGPRHHLGPDSGTCWQPVFFQLPRIMPGCRNRPWYSHTQVVHWQPHRLSWTSL